LRTIAIANLKGGTGKTTTCHALGAALASQHGRHVLLVDCDPQGSLTGACGVHDGASKSLAQVLDRSYDRSIELELLMYHTIRKVSPGLYLVPAEVGLADSEQRLVSREHRESALRNALATVARGYHVALLDCPSELGLLTANALTAADAVLIPTIPDILDLRALKLFLDVIQHYRRSFNPRLHILGILITLLDIRTIHHQRIVDAMHGLNFPVLDVTIGRSIRVADAINAGESIVTYEPQHKEAEAYRQLAAFVDRWISTH
jgi:chromosome partitioning protein